ncbi:hypothetical protein PBC1_022 [Bacillus phage PBC1]|uniref:BppU N-terminal domain-containing protein n=1 Tax=Bacillus phage PBC1 TaxID=1161901 RepID=I1TLF6_9CAUD|nr:minor tail protein [Bacillus phage PBC1]AFE86258.1 hypothetical protein PBC1_022 [Bacillus phage PBC1]
MADELFKLKSIELDTFLDKNNNPVTYFSQGDRLSDKLYIDLSNRDTEIDLATASQVRIDFRKPDKKLVFQYCLIEDAAKGIVSVILNSQTVAVAGEVYAEVTVIYPNGKRVVTRQFTFLVTEAIAGDASIESSDFAPMIDRAVELGDLMVEQNVTPQQLVNAGSLAANSLPKSGGTMTGNIDMDISVGSKSKGYRWRDANGALFGLETSTTGELILYDYKNGGRVFQFDPTSRRFTVLSDTNLLKKTGDTMTGPLDINSGIFMRLKGETGKRDWIVFRDSAHESVVFAPRLADNSDWDWSKQIEFRPDNFIVNGSTNLMKKTDYTAKDGRADLVLTADAANFDTSRPPGAVRRGNTVTIRGAIGVSASATANLVTTLPTDMRPIDSLTQTILTNDGSATTLEVYPDGRVILSNSAKGKNIYIVFTYVVD